MDYLQPPLRKNSANQPRRAGFELEFGGLTSKETAESLQNRLGGRLRQHNPYRYELTECALGTLKIERDAELLNSVKYRDILSQLNVDFNPNTLASEIEHGIDRISSLIIPCEIVTEPLVHSDFSKLDQVVELLNDLRAKGTQENFFYAFGLHINPSVPDLEITTLLAYLRAFLLLSDWLIDDSGIDFSRRFFTNYINPFPPAYLDTVLHPDYHPDTTKLIADYLTHNPTRNRALDMLPVLCEKDQEQVLAGVNKEERSLISGRPAFHYRLPDCRLGEQNWSIAREWNRWWYVEALAADPALRSELLGLWLKHNKEELLANKKKWVATVGSFLTNHLNPSSPPP